MQQTVHIQNRYIGEGGKLISDILDISDKVNIDDSEGATQRCS